MEHIKLTEVYWILIWCWKIETIAVFQGAMLRNPGLIGKTKEKQGKKCNKTEVARKKRLNENKRKWICDEMKRNRSGTFRQWTHKTEWLKANEAKRMISAREESVPLPTNAFTMLFFPMPIIEFAVYTFILRRERERGRKAHIMNYKWKTRTFRIAVRSLFFSFLF